MYIASDAGRAHSFGMEASLAWSPFQELTVFGNYSHIDGKFNDKDENGNKQDCRSNASEMQGKNLFHPSLLSIDVILLLRTSK